MIATFVDTTSSPSEFQPARIPEQAAFFQNRFNRHARSNMLKVTKAVFPVAGLGTRFLPATKASPKEMLPIVDKPLIQYAVEEAM
ncbi:sugar phosphate nucleotidyltransferase, partial [Paraburkholderia caribensis]|uniref:sugar phosphate nucleotidyltransferase n=1 Tax=Paraburkholderia caribensis TaxID=75105 RepID=UPI002090DC9A